jgi:hypothetical protein
MGVDLDISKHIHLIQEMSFGPTDYLQKFFNDVHKLTPGPPHGHSLIRNSLILDLEGLCIEGVRGFALYYVDDVRSSFYSG